MLILRKHYRLPNYNYSEDGLYFVTICTLHREKEYLSKIIDGKTQLNPIGLIADKIWNELPEKFLHLTLDEYVIMPDHIHGILHLEKLNPSEQDSSGQTGVSFIPSNCMLAQAPNLSRIMRDFKGKVKYEAAKSGFPDFSWQPRFYDRIIRDDIEYYFIQEYIKNNPVNWGQKEINIEEYFKMQ